MVNDWFIFFFPLTVKSTSCFCTLCNILYIFFTFESLYSQWKCHASNFQKVWLNVLPKGQSHPVMEQNWYLMDHSDVWAETLKGNGRVEIHPCSEGQCVIFPLLQVQLVSFYAFSVIQCYILWRKKKKRKGSEIITYYFFLALFISICFSISMCH